MDIGPPSLLVPLDGVVDRKDEEKEPWFCPKVARDLGLVPSSRASVSPSVLNRLGPSGSDNLVMPGWTLAAEGETSPSQMPPMPWVPLMLWVPSRPAGLVQCLFPVLHPESWWQPLPQCPESP